MHFSQWHIPLSDDRMTLSQALNSLERVGAAPSEIPFIVRVMENPDYCNLRFNRFAGSVYLRQHDIIHILLGRGLLSQDEAFVIGFTMGSSGNLTVLEARIFSWISKHLYPCPYSFNDNDLFIYRKAIQLASQMDVRRLDQLNLSDFESWPLWALRRHLRINVPALQAFYRWESCLYPDCQESRRIAA